MREKTRLPQDVRNRTKEESCRILFQAEMTYLASRGWTFLCGIPGRYMIAPGEDLKATNVPRFSHEEALKIQKEKDAVQGS